MSKEILQQTRILIEELNKTNGSNDKMKTLAEHPECKQILHYIYNEFKMYGITSARISKLVDVPAIKSYSDIFVLLDALANGNITGHKAVSSVKGFISYYPEYEDIILKIIDKDLMIGMGTSNINKVFKNLIPKFDVALANSYDKVSGKINKEEYYGSHKLDGLRCICIKNGNDVRFYSRKGKEFLTLDKIKNAILNLNYKSNFVLDGELCIVDAEGKEDFTAIMKVYKKKDFTIPNPKYKIFDMLTIEEFESKTSKRILSKRLEKLNEYFADQNLHLDVLEQVKMNEDTFAEMQKKATDNGWEGLILRRDTIYKGKRSNDLLKVKKFFDAEYVVNSIEKGMYQVVEDGERKEIETLTAVHITHKGFDVKVGSGFSLDQRKAFYADPRKILGKTITVQYFEETTNEKGGISLRFPTLKYIYDGERMA